MQQAVYITGQPPRRVKTLPTRITQQLLRHREFRGLLAVSPDHLEKLLLGHTVGTIQYYSPSEPPLVPHVDSGELALVIGVRFPGPIDESLRFFDIHRHKWVPVTMALGSVVIIPSGVLHMVKRPAGERATIIIMCQVLALLIDLVTQCIVSNSRQEAKSVVCPP